MKLTNHLYNEMREARSLGVFALVALIEQATQVPVTGSQFVMAFKSAFPEIPLKTLQIASSWVGLGGRSLDDNDFEQMLAPWLSHSVLIKSPLAVLPASEAVSVVSGMETPCVELAPGPDQP